MGSNLCILHFANGYDALLRRINLTLLNSSSPVLQHSYEFDPDSGRLDTVSDGAHSATYGYLDNSSLVEQIQFKQSTTTRMTTTKSYVLRTFLTS